MNKHRAAGRGGAGAVMGSKNLKAIAVKGRLSGTTADPRKAAQISRDGGKMAMEGGAAFAKYGSSIALNVFNEANTLPTRNFRAGHFAEIERIDDEALKNGFFVKDRGCFACPLKCGNVHTVKEEPCKLPS